MDACVHAHTSFGISVRIDTHGPCRTDHPDCDGHDNDRSAEEDNDLPEVPLDWGCCGVPRPGNHRNAGVPVADCGPDIHRRTGLPANANDCASEDVGVVVEVRDDNDRRGDRNRTDDRTDPAAAPASWAVAVPGAYRPAYPDDPRVCPRRRCRCVPIAVRPLAGVPRIPR